ncbi:sensor histidine kinase [Micromonospora sp. WMMD729]|uniref:sensor histidine kinase n=1 Tax=Micromonospora sp. WMMD729 TaxID=3404127 RepID=UPI003BF59311
MNAMHPRLHAVLGEPPVAPVPSRVWRDWALVAVLAPAIVAEGVLRADLPWRTGCVVIALALLPTLLWRRAAPLAMVAIGFGCATVAPFVLPGDPCRLITASFLVLLTYALFRWGSGRAAVIGSLFVLAKVIAGGVFGSNDGGELVAGFAVMVAAATLGVAIRFRAAARQRELDRVKLLERERLARDLHDTVAHHVSAMAIRAQAGIAASVRQPDAAVEALRTIEAEASRALAEMRAMVRVLRRGEPADLVPNPRATDIGRLAGRFRTGPTVDVDLRGDLGGLPPALGAALYRLAQESVTNARRHARHATRIEVSVAADDTAVRLRVTDDGEAGAARPAGPPGFGLMGMRERADLLGGTCEAGPNPDRGWTVTAVLPRAGVGA